MEHMGIILLILALLFFGLYLQNCKVRELESMIKKAYLGKFDRYAEDLFRKMHKQLKVLCIHNDISDEERDNFMHAIGGIFHTVVNDTKGFEKDVLGMVNYGFKQIGDVSGVKSIVDVSNTIRDVGNTIEFFQTHSRKKEISEEAMMVFLTEGDHDFTKRYNSSIKLIRDMYK